MRRYIQHLSETGRHDASEVGGKGANLGELLATGFTVPHGFCVTTQAYREFVTDTGLQERISAEIERSDLTSAGVVRECGKRLQQLVVGSEMPEGVKEAILRAYREFSRQRHQGPHVAVRSSATSEDSAYHSFAGQHDTYLNVSCESDLLLSVKKCWASLWTERAISYREEHNLGHLSIHMAVVIQELVPSSVSGVAFTANPVTGDLDEVVINANWGLGSSVVAGKVPVDEYRVDKRRLTIISKRIPEKNIMTVLGREGTVDTAIPSEKRTHQCLSDENVGRLSSIAKQIEDQFGLPQDIEWGLYEDQLFVLQSRPITGLGRAGKPMRVLWGNPVNQKLLKDKVVFWSNWNTREIFPHPFTPLTWSHFVEMIGPGFLESLFGMTESSPLYRYSAIVDLVHGRLYWNMNLMYGHPLWGPLFSRLVPQLDEEAGRLFRKLYEDGELQPAELPIRFPTLWLGVIRGTVVFFSSPWYLSGRRLKRRCDDYWHKACQFENLELADRSNADLIRQVREFTAYTIRYWAPLLLASFSAVLALEVIKYLTRRLPDVTPNTLLAGIPGNKTTEGALELYRLSQLPGSLKAIFLSNEAGEIASLLEESQEGRVFLKRLDEFMQLYGHRGPREFDMGHPRWKDDPSFVYQMIKNYLQLGESDETPLEHFSRMREERERLTELVTQRLSQSMASRLFPWRRWLFKAMLRRVHTYLPFRENPKYYALKCYYGSRRIFLEVGRRLSEAGYLGSRDDIWFLSLSELEALLQDKDSDRKAVRELVLQRKREWERHLSIDPPLVVRSDGKTFSYPGRSRADAGVLNGTPTSGGRVTGKARVILDPAEGCAFNKGEILVALHTDPGWTPLFLTAKALVMEVGGVVSHGAIVAREYGIPAVVGVRDATTIIKNGDEITVDGDQGTVSRGWPREKVR